MATPVRPPSPGGRKQPTPPTTGGQWQRVDPLEVERYRRGPITRPHISRLDRLRERIAVLGYYWDRLRGIPEDMDD